MSEISNAAQARPDVIAALKELLAGSSIGAKVHWGAICNDLVDQRKLCDNAEAVAAMNMLVKPQGPVSGLDHHFWIGEQA